MRSMQELFDTCVSVGLTSSHREFSHLWNRAESWFSSALSRQHERRLSTESLLAFYFSLLNAERHSDVMRDHGRANAVRQMRTEVWDEIARRCVSKRGQPATLGNIPI